MRGVRGSSGIYTGSPPDSGLVGTNGEVVSGWRAVPSAEVVREGKSVKGPGLCLVALWHGVAGVTRLILLCGRWVMTCCLASSF